MNTYDDDRYDNALNEIDRLRAELSSAMDAHTADHARFTAQLEEANRTIVATLARANEQRKAIARVRELCAFWDATRYHATDWADRILRALDGGTE